VVQSRPLSGGSINQAMACDLADGRRVFVKSNPAADPRMFPAEARGLEWLRGAGAIRVPEVLAVNRAEDSVPYLVLELIEPGGPAAGYAEALGRGLAALHLAGAPWFGLDHDNFLATLEQDNTPAEDWPSFFIHRRLEPQVRLAVDGGTAPASWIDLFERVYARMGELAGPSEPPARLHGDLWTGNLHTDPAGQPVLVDPAVYGGHREIDLAMLELFGSPGPRAFAAYDEVYPRAPGHQDRVPLYQLYPLLAHVNLFGKSYVGAVEAALRRLL
jgi:fructosamine-3-kinase